MPFSIKKVSKVTALQNILLKIKSKNTKEKLGQWIDDNKSVYIREDLPYNLIHYNNLGVIEADKFRKNLTIQKNQPVRIEREIIPKIMKLFTKERTAWHYKIDGLPF